MGPRQWRPALRESLALLRRSAAALHGLAQGPVPRGMAPRLDDAAAEASDPPPAAADADGTRFGHALKAKYFLQEASLTNLNNGSFGAAPQ